MIKLDTAAAVSSREYLHAFGRALLASHVFQITQLLPLLFRTHHFRLFRFFFHPWFFPLYPQCTMATRFVRLACLLTSQSQYPVLEKLLMHVLGYWKSKDTVTGRFLQGLTTGNGAALLTRTGWSQAQRGALDLILALLTRLGSRLAGSVHGNFDRLAVCRHLAGLRTYQDAYWKALACKSYKKTVM